MSVKNKEGTDKRQIRQRKIYHLAYIIFQTYIGIHFLVHN
mgnify:FL=1